MEIKLTTSDMEKSMQEQKQPLAEDKTSMKKCPFCAEQIQAEAVKCRYCGEFLDGSSRSGSRTRPKKWYFSTSNIIVTFLFVGPLALPLVWFHPHYKKNTKIIITTIVSIVTALVICLLIKLLPSIFQYYSQLDDLMKQLNHVGY